MGNKCNPQTVRIGILGWKSAWCANKKEDYSHYVKEDYVIRSTIENMLDPDLVSEIKIKRSAKSSKSSSSGAEVLVTIGTGRPGAVIGREGAVIKSIKQKLSSKLPDLKMVVDIMETYKPETNAKLIAASIAKQIAERKNYRRAVNSAISMAMKSSVEGIKIIVSGRLNGSSIARTETFLKGSVPLACLRKHITYKHEQSKTTYGIVGVCVYVNTGETNAGTTIF